MRTSVKLILTALAASLLLSAMVSTASARNLSTTNQNIRATWTSLEFAVSREVTIRCQVTLEGSFHTRTIAKVDESLIGYITRAIVKQEACTSGTGAAFNGTERYNGGTPANSLPWHIRYKGFTGTLPTISAIRIGLRGARFGIRDSIGLCTGQYGNETDIIQADAALGAGGAVTSLTPVVGSNNATLIRRDGGLACPATGALVGSGLVFLLGTTNAISVTLI